MRMQTRWVTVAAAVLMLTAVGAVRAAEPTPTTITIPEMDCLTCYKKIAVKLAAVPGVGKQEADTEARTVRIMPKGQAALSPRALWEAVEKSGKKPTKLEGPSGTFTTKPKS